MLEALAPMTGPDNVSDLRVFAARFTHPGRHPMIARSQLSEGERGRLAAGLVGVDVLTHGSLTDRFGSVVAAAGSELLADAGFRADVQGLPFAPGDRLLALGDSITDDACSWAELLRELLSATNPGVEVVNAGLSGNTTSQVIERIDLLANESPTWVIQLLGTNDARRHGHGAPVRNVSPSESLRNLQELEQLIVGDLGARLVRMTPPPVIEERASRWPLFVRSAMTWHAADIADLAQQIVRLDPMAVDLHAALSGPGLETWLLPDGVHPSFAGQQQILRTLVHHLASETASAQRPQRSVSHASTTRRQNMPAPPRSAGFNPVDRIAAAPISWGVCEVPGWGYQMPAAQVLADMQSLGLSATEFGPDGFLPRDSSERAALLKQYGLRPVGGFLPVVLHDPLGDPMPQVDLFIDACLASGAGVVVLAAATGVDGYDMRPVLVDDDWKTILANLDVIAAHAESRGVLAVVHPHMGTMIEGFDDVQRVLDGSRIGLCVDTGHLVAAGADPVAIARDNADRIGHVHLKDVDATKAARVVSGEISFADAVADGMWTVLGEGSVDVGAMIAALEAAGYEGWYVLEQDLMLRSAELNAEGPVGNVRRCLAFVEEALAECRGEWGRG